MKIAICVCFSEKNINHHEKILRNINQIIIPKGYHLKFYAVLNRNVLYLNNLIKKIINKKEINIKVLTTFKKNIPSARNVFIDHLKKQKINFVGFLDDDCMIDRKWILKMTQFISNNNCDIVGGPQLHEVTNNKFKIYYKFLEPQHLNKKEVNWIATNNCFFKKSIIDSINIRFDENLKNIGGSDQLFFRKLKKKGFTIKWNVDAKVKEYKQKDRENLSWFLKRNFRYGFSGLIIDKKIYGKKTGYIINIIKIFYLSFIGFSNFFFIFKNYHFINSTFYFSKALGRLSAMFKFKLSKYY